jgi:hypothetical protein
MTGIMMPAVRLHHFGLALRKFQTLDFCCTECTSRVNGDCRFRWRALVSVTHDGSRGEQRRQGRDCMYSTVRLYSLSHQSTRQSLQSSPLAILGQTGCNSSFSISTNILLCILDNSVFFSTYLWPIREPRPLKRMPAPLLKPSFPPHTLVVRGVDRIRLAEGTTPRQTLVNTTMNVVPQKVKNFWTRRETVGSSRSTLLHEVSHHGPRWKCRAAGSCVELSVCQWRAAIGHPRDLWRAICANVFTWRVEPRASRWSDWHSCVVFPIPRVPSSAQRPALLNEGFPGFPQSLQTNTIVVL